jgi:hypothetical protein
LAIASKFSRGSRAQEPREKKMRKKNGDYFSEISVSFGHCFFSHKQATMSGRRKGSQTADTAGM